MASFDETQIADPQLIQIKRNIIGKLPQDLVIKIYKEYLEADVYYTIYKNIIEDPISQRLNGKLLIPFIPIILSKPVVCKYIREHCPNFCSSFKKHKIENHKKFVLMKKGESFAATILFSRYH
jgi:hypothetical protein